MGTPNFASVLAASSETSIGSVLPSAIRFLTLASASSCSHERHHIAGAVGAGLADRLFDLKWIERIKDSRAVRVTPAGRKGLQATFGIDHSA